MKIKYRTICRGFVYLALFSFLGTSLKAATHRGVYTLRRSAYLWHKSKSLKDIPTGKQPFSISSASHQRLALLSQFGCYTPVSAIYKGRKAIQKPRPLCRSSFSGSMQHAIPTSVTSTQLHWGAKQKGKALIASPLASLTKYTPKRRGPFLKNSWGMLFFSGGAGILLYWYRTSPQVQAMGYEDGYFSIHTFEDTMDWLEEQTGSLPIEDPNHAHNTEVLYNTTTQLLFDVQQKIIQCKLISKATGYDLYKKDWRRHKELRTRAERLVRRLCQLNSNLTPIADMAELERVFFQGQNQDDRHPMYACLEGVGKAVIDLPRNTFKSVGRVVRMPFDFFRNTVDVLAGHPELKNWHSRYHEDLSRFIEKYKANKISGEAATEEVIKLVLEGYNIIWHIELYKGGNKLFQSCADLLKSVRENREVLHDEFCLIYDKKWAIDSFMEKFAEMSAAQRAELISYTLTNIVGEALLLQFLGDIAGIGDLENLGKNSALGRWISKTKGGRRFFRKIKKVHLKLRRSHAVKLGKGSATADKVRVITCAEGMKRKLEPLVNTLKKSDVTAEEILSVLKHFEGRKFKEVKDLLDRLLPKNWERGVLKEKGVLKGQGFKYTNQSTNGSVTFQLNRGYPKKWQTAIHRAPYLKFTYGPPPVYVPLITGSTLRSQAFVICPLLIEKIAPGDEKNDQ